jgi:hypothetical protein
MCIKEEKTNNNAYICRINRNSSTIKNEIMWIAKNQGWDFCTSWWAPPYAEVKTV